jgi:phage tail-like protein
MTMDDRPTKYAVLRDLRAWDSTVRTSNLQPRSDGVLELVSLPGTLDTENIRLPRSYDVAPSGVAVRRDGTTFTALTTAGHIAVSIEGCDAHDERQVHAGRKLNQPSALLLVGDLLYIADTGNSRIAVVDADSFDCVAEREDGLQSPTGLARDTSGRIYVLDWATRRVMRFSDEGTSDAAFNAAIATHASIVAPVSICVDENDTIYLPDTTSGILRFDTSGAELAHIPPPHPGFKPGALTASGNHLYIADIASGYVAAYDITLGKWLGSIESYRGPVAALAVDTAGALCIKPGQDAIIHRLAATAARVRDGSLVAGPFDAGINDSWERVWVNAEVPDGATLELDLAAGGATEPTQWIRSLSRDTLLRTLGLDAVRSLWIRVRVASDGSVSPRLLQVQAATAEPSFIEHLPSIYRRDDTHRFLENWLASFRSELRGLEGTMEQLPRELDPRTVEEGNLDALAAWLAMPLPRQDTTSLRTLLADAHELNRRRGTPAGLREMIKRYVGADVHVFEAFCQRRLWMLDTEPAQGLGLDTMLPAATPDGLIVPGSTLADPAFSGLRGDYYGGTNFENLRTTRRDPEVNFNWLATPLPEKISPKNVSVRWSGQVRPRFSEVYTFRTRSDGGVRLRVSGRSLIDDRTLHAVADKNGQIRLEAGRWYPIVLELFSQSGATVMELHWSSASERSQVVPHTALYPILEDSVEFEPAGSKVMEVGSAVVGEGRPQEAESFGAALADDFAHVFTVVVPAAQVPRAAQRQALRDLIEAEKPAHTECQLCLAEPRMRVGLQARIGVDAIVGGDPPPNRLGDVVLGMHSYLGAE